MSLPHIHFDIAQLPMLQSVLVFMRGFAQHLRMSQQEVLMKRVSILLLILMGVGMTGCARPGEVGWGTAYSRKELDRQIARNWDWEGKQLVDDVERALLLRPMGHLTLWELR